MLLLRNAPTRQRWVAEEKLVLCSSNREIFINKILSPSLFPPFYLNFASWTWISMAKDDKKELQIHSLPLCDAWKFFFRLLENSRVVKVLFRSKGTKKMALKPFEDYCCSFELFHMLAVVVSVLKTESILPLKRNSNICKNSKSFGVKYVEHELPSQRQTCHRAWWLVINSCSLLIIQHEQRFLCCR